MIFANFYEEVIDTYFVEGTRIDELENLLNCKIKSKVTMGQSLEKYHAVIDEQEVLLRIYNDNYYTNRFLREGLILRELSGNNPTFHSPRIKEEWPEHQIRAIEWFDFDYTETKFDKEEIIKWIQDQEINLPYSLKSDLVPHLNDTMNIHIAYREFYDDHVSKLLSKIDWNQGDEVLIHGDLHPGNISSWNRKTVIYDWEYATLGSEFYDPAYYSTSQLEIAPSIHIIWQYLAALVHCHWYLQDDNFSPKEVIKWVEFVAEIGNKV